jgi:catechol 2,3-dioxygenase-like lactoylglutathione lyase family enzyme
MREEQSVPPQDTPHLIQIAICSTNIVRTVQFLSEGVGFAEAGREALWGPAIAQTQGLGDDAACVIWWLTGCQEFKQIEVFQHTDPPPAPLPEDWRPSDLGWVSWGCAVPDFDSVVTRLAAMSVQPISPPRVYAGRRRMAVRIPHVGTIMEIIEDAPCSDAPAGPRIVHATLSVQDLAAARGFWVKSLAARECDPETLHTLQMEELWGLEGAQNERCVMQMHDCYLELVEYRSPEPRARSGRRLCDQGMQNIGIGFRDFGPLRAFADRAEHAGARLEMPREHERDAPCGNYATTPDGFSFEAFSLPLSWDEVLGFRAITSGLKARLWETMTS